MDGEVVFWLEEWFIMLNLATGELGVLSRCLQVCLAFLGQNLRCYLSWVLALLLLEQSLYGFLGPKSQVLLLLSGLYIRASLSSGTGSDEWLYFRAGLSSWTESAEWLYFRAGVSTGMSSELNFQ